MKRIDGLDICIYTLISVTVIAVVMVIISFIGLYCQKENFISQNEYCVVLDKDSHLTPQVIGRCVTPRCSYQINTVGLTTQDTVTIEVDRYVFNYIEVGDTIKTINLK